LVSKISDATLQKLDDRSSRTDDTFSRALAAGSRTLATSKLVDATLQKLDDRSSRTDDTLSNHDALDISRKSVKARIDGVSAVHSV
jgi:hypothetical protein